MKTTAILAAALVGLAAAPALAQPDGAGGAPPYAEMRAQRQAEMTADVRIVLHIRPDQEAAYQAFLSAIHPQAAGPQAPADPAAVEAAYQRFSTVLTPDQQQVLAALRRLALEHPRWGGGRRHHMDGGGEGEGGPQ